MSNFGLIKSGLLYDQAVVQSVGQLVVTMLCITNIQANMLCKSSENPTNQSHGPMGSPLHTYGPHQTP